MQTAMLIQNTNFSNNLNQKGQHKSNQEKICPLKITYARRKLFDLKYVIVEKEDGFFWSLYRTNNCLEVNL